MASFPLLTLVLSPLLLGGIASEKSAEKELNVQRLAENEIVIGDTVVDPIITGQTRSDTVFDWEKRNFNDNQCVDCTTINPYPLELDE